VISTPCRVSVTGSTRVGGGAATAGGIRYLPERAGRLRWQLGNWELAPHLELSDECTVHPRPTRLENFFFMHEIVQRFSAEAVSV